MKASVDDRLLIFSPQSCISTFTQVPSPSPFIHYQEILNIPVQSGLDIFSKPSVKKEFTKKNELYQ